MMASDLFRKMTLQSLKIHRKTESAFVLFSSIFMSLVYITFSNINNPYVQKRHESLSLIMTFAALFVLALSGVFILYANHFMMKQKYKEVALYSVFGLEKKHIHKMLGLEMIIKYLIIAGISLPGNYLFGSLFFMLVNKLMEGTATGFFEYLFNPTAAIITLSVLLLILMAAFLMNVLKVSISNPLELMKSSSKGEEEPKSNMVLMILGLVSTLWGYYIAFTSEGVIASLFNIFKAIILVILGTYFLFNSLSIFLLKMLRKNKSYYYKTENFLSISGMLYRMKANGTSLAGIAILSTGLMMVLGMTFTSYLSMEDIVQSSLEADYQLYYSGNPDKLQQVVREMEEHVDLVRVSPYRSMEILSNLSDGKIQAIEEDFSLDDGKNANEKVWAAVVMTVQDYNRAYDTNLFLDHHRIGFSTNALKSDHFDQIGFMGRAYQVEKLDEKPATSSIMDHVLIVIPDELPYEEVSRTFPWRMGAMYFIRMLKSRPIWMRKEI